MSESLNVDYLYEAIDYVMDEISHIDESRFIDQTDLEVLSERLSGCVFHDLQTVGEIYKAAVISYAVWFIHKHSRLPSKDELESEVGI